MQIIHLSGNLTKDAEIKSNTVQGHTNEFIAFRLAVNEIGGTTENTTYYDVTCQKTGIFDWLKQGTKVNVCGKFRFRVTKGNDGKEYTHLNVLAYSVELTGSKKIEQSAPAPDESI